MRSKLLVCAALASLGVCSSLSSVARAAGKHKAPAASKDDKKKPNELHADDKSMKKQLQWEDKVMGPDDKRAELEKIARANAINEKAAKEREKQAALEAAAPKAPPPEVGKGKAKGLRNEVAIPATAEEKQLNDSDRGKAHEISPKLATDEAKAPAPAAKPADDKFIDKLLREERPSTGKKSSANDRELDALLAGAKDKPAGRRGRRDDVDDMIKNAEKGPAMPAPRAPAATPDWMKQPEIASTPAPASVAPPPPAPSKAKDDGVIHVVQGAVAAQAASPAPAPVATRGLNVRKRGGKGATAAAPVVWNDPFADKKTVASRDRDRDRDQEAYAPTPRKEPTARPVAPTPASWSDPFADSPEPRRTTHRTAAPAAPAAPAPKRQKADGEAGHPAGWKDPFTKAPAEPTHAPVAMRELNKGESSKWEIAARRASPSHAAPVADSHVGGWGVLKKRAR